MATTIYRGFQNPRSIDEYIFKRMINGISNRKYDKAVLEVPPIFLSLEEDLEETLFLHRFGIFSKIDISFKTINYIKNIMRQIGVYKDPVNY